MRTVRYHSEARAEFLEQVDYYAAISPRLAEHFDRAVQTAETQARRRLKHGQSTEARHAELWTANSSSRWSIFIAAMMSMSSLSRQCGVSPATGGRALATHNISFHRTACGAAGLQRYAKSLRSAM